MSLIILAIRLHESILSMFFILFFDIYLKNVKKGGARNMAEYT